jgi:serine protease Do
MKLVGVCWGRRAGVSKRWLGGVLLGVALSAAAAPALADDASTKKKKVAVGFSNLVARLDNDEIGFAKPEYRVHILEALRNAGFNAVGAENLVFDKDDGERADIVLGGTVKELSCKQMQRELRCSVGIEWQLLDRERDEVVYQALTRFAAFQLPRDNDAAVGKTLTIGALRSLMDRPRFRTLLSAEGQGLPDDAAEYQPATFTRCDAQARELPGDFDAIADGTVIIKSGGGIGSGFTLGADGLVMTAAHVVASGKLEIRTHDGKTFQGRVVRISRKHDVALVSVGTLVAARPCLPLESAPQTPGTDVYAIGSPGGEQLGFSLSRGIVSGLRTIGDVPLIQTDASLSPGNSGGPLVDRQGRVVGVVSRKIAGHAVEGLGFAIPIQAGLDALKLVPAGATTESLRQSPAPVVAPSKASVNDSPDAPVSLDPVGDKQRAQAADYQRRLNEQRAATPGYVAPMRWLGLTVGIVGSLGVTFTGLQNTGEMTRPEYESLRLKNDLFWAATGVGWGAFAASWFFVPKLGPSKVGGSSRWSVAASPRDVQLNVSFQ